MIVIPEIRVKTILDALLDKIKTNYVNSTEPDKSDTFLYKMYNGLEVDRYDFLTESVFVFNRTSDDPNTIDTRLLFDMERASLPTIHVTIPSSRPEGDGLGYDEGYIANTADTDPLTATTYNVRGYGSKFELVITGRSQFEVLLIYYTVLATLINNHLSLDINGLRNPKIYGGDFRINDSLGPQPIYVKSIMIDSFFELVVPRFESISIVNNIEFKGTAYEN